MNAISCEFLLLVREVLASFRAGKGLALETIDDPFHLLPVVARITGEKSSSSPFAGSQ